MQESSRQRAATRASLEQLTKTAAQEREQTADSLLSGQAVDGEGSIRRMKGQFEQSAAQVTGSDAVAMRAMAGFLEKMQSQVRDYEASVAQLTASNVFRFNLPDRVTLDTHRQVIRTFLTNNARLTATVQQGKELVRAELEAARVPTRSVNEIVDGYAESQVAIRPLMLKIRACDGTLGDNALTTLDLLENNWGRWHPDADGKLLFDDDATLETYNALIGKIQAAAAEQAKFQQLLATHIKSSKPKPGP